MNSQAQVECDRPIFRQYTEIIGADDPWCLVPPGYDQSLLLWHEPDVSVASVDVLAANTEPKIVQTGRVALPAVLYAGRFACWQDKKAVDDWRRWPSSLWLVPREALVRLGGTTYRVRHELEGGSRQGIHPLALTAEGRLGSADDAGVVRLHPRRAIYDDSLISAADGTRETDWRRIVTTCQKWMQRGLVQKVVPCRRDVAFAQPGNDFDPLDTAERLRARYPDNATFVIGDATGLAYVGSTPEVLIEKRGHRVSADALAGTSRGTSATELLHNAKNLCEHGYVVDDVRRKLTALCGTVEVSRVHPMHLAELCHLHTRLAGDCREPLAMSALIAAMHPTPAVCGYPYPAALAVLAELEGFDRGFYTGPIGWTDAAGDGRIRVALRAGLLARDRAVLFAGAGIVRGSVWQREWDETELKLEAMKSCLTTRRATRSHKIKLSG